MALEMKNACERCHAQLDSQGEAYICSFECTFCVGCDEDLNGTCPNCGGELVRRPKRKKKATQTVAAYAGGSLQPDSIPAQCPVSN